MAMEQWDPVQELARLQRRLNDMFDEVLDRSGDASGLGVGRAWQPPIDLFERSQAYVLRADLPGIHPDQVDIQVEDGTLTLRGQRSADETVNRESYLRVERPHGPFLVQIALPPTVDPEGIVADQRGGVIEVTLPKRPEAPSAPIRIPVGQNDEG